MATLLAKSFGASLVMTYAESKLLTPRENKQLFAATPALLIGIGFWFTTFGFKVGSARRKYMDLAKEHGEENVEERYGLPNLYAQGTSVYARAFNCAQRAHQHVMENFPQVIISSLVGAYTYPVSAALTTACYFMGRVAMSEGYASAEDGDASKRYDSKLAVFMWYGLITNMMTGLLSCVNMAAGTKIW